MTLDANSYRVNIKPIYDMTIEKTPKERLQFLSILAVATGVPIVIVACYLGELYGFDEPLIAQLERLKLFYTVKEVLNVKYE